MFLPRENCLSKNLCVCRLVWNFESRYHKNNFSYLIIKFILCHEDFCACIFVLQRWLHCLYVVCAYCVLALSLFLKNSLPLFLWLDLHQMLRSKAYLSLVVQMVLVLQRWGCKFDVLELSHTWFSMWILSFIPSSSLPALVLIRKLSFIIRFINREGIDFSDAQSMQAVQVLPVSMSGGDSWRNFDA